jgi:anthranilate synthase/aminodeoxychorismate synthase-like glutamine amidotransferase
VATLLVIDNYDSFTYNLVQMFKQYELRIQVHRSDRINLQRAAAVRPDYILVGPGPKDPAHAGISKTLIETFYRTIPTLGVCLGMQCINEVFGGRTVRAKTPVHGKTNRIYHRQDTIFENIPSPFRAARYHSLAISPSPEAVANDLIVTATASDDTIMGLSHRHFPLHGVQFHPESFMTQHGFRLVENFLRLGPLKNHLAAGAGPWMGDPFGTVEAGAGMTAKACGR